MSHANTLASFSATVSDICADSAAWNSELSMVALAVRIRVCTGFSVIWAANPAVVTHDVQCLGLADLARQLLHRAIAMGELDGVARLQEVQALADAGQLPNRREIGGIECHAPEDSIQRVVAADDDDGRGNGGLLRRGRRGWGTGREGRREWNPLDKPAAPDCPQPPRGCRGPRARE